VASPSRPFVFVDCSVVEPAAADHADGSSACLTVGGDVDTAAGYADSITVETVADRVTNLTLYIG